MNELDQDLGDPGSALQKATYVVAGINLGCFFFAWIAVKCSSSATKQKRSEEQENFIVQ